MAPAGAFPIRHRSYQNTTDNLQVHLITDRNFTTSHFTDKPEKDSSHSPKPRDFYHSSAVIELLDLFLE